MIADERPADLICQFSSSEECLVVWGAEKSLLPTTRLLPTLVGDQKTDAEGYSERD